MISVCMATYNGEKYIKEQLDSILIQLSEGDEVIVSDDCSTDSTLDIVRDFHDPRIKILEGVRFGSPVFNFENALKHAVGDIVFLSDQDDVWLEGRVEGVLPYLKEKDLVINDCIVVDQNKVMIRDSFYTLSKPRIGVLKNLMINSYLGCCMAFNREILEYVLPFPRKIAMHDIWIGLNVDYRKKSVFVDKKLVLYRRHGGNASPTGEISSNSLLFKIKYRLEMLCLIFLRRIYG